MTLYNWIRLLVTLGLVVLLFLCSAGILGLRAAQTSPNLAISSPLTGVQLTGSFELKGTGKPGDELEIFEGTTSLGKARVGPDGTWSYSITSPAVGDHTYEARGSGEPAQIRVSIAQAPTTNCTKAFSLSSPTDGQTLSAPFRFGGEGRGTGYSVTIKRGERVIGTKEVGLDASCGWSYQSNPGPGPVTYEVRELGGTAVLSTIHLNVQ